MRHIIHAMRATLAPYDLDTFDRYLLRVTAIACGVSLIALYLH